MKFHQLYLEFTQGNLENVGPFFEFIFFEVSSQYYGNFFVYFFALNLLTLIFTRNIKWWGFLVMVVFSVILTSIGIDGMVGDFASTLDITPDRLKTVNRAYWAYLGLSISLLACLVKTMILRTNFRENMTTILFAMLLYFAIPIHIALISGTMVTDFHNTLERDKLLIRDGEKVSFLRNCRDSQLQCFVIAQEFPPKIQEDPYLTNVLLKGREEKWRLKAESEVLKTFINPDVLTGGPKSVIYYNNGSSERILLDVYWHNIPHKTHGNMLLFLVGLLNSMVFLVYFPVYYYHRKYARLVPLDQLSPLGFIKS